MTQVKRTLLHAVLGSMLATGALLAQEPPPMEAFKAVHLVALTASQASTLRAALADLNAAVAAAGHPEVRYRLYRWSASRKAPTTTCGNPRGPRVRRTALFTRVRLTR